MEQGLRIKDQGSRIQDQGPRIKDQGPRTKDQGSRTKDQGPRIKDHEPCFGTNEHPRSDTDVILRQSKAPIEIFNFRWVLSNAQQSCGPATAPRTDRMWFSSKVTKHQSIKVLFFLCWNACFLTLKWNEKSMKNVSKNQSKINQKWTKHGPNIGQNWGLEGSRAGLEASWAVLGDPKDFWGHLGSSWRRLGSVLGGKSGQHGSNLAPSWVPTWS